MVEQVNLFSLPFNFAARISASLPVHPEPLFSVFFSIFSSLHSKRMVPLSIFSNKMVISSSFAFLYKLVQRRDPGSRRVAGINPGSQTAAYRCLGGNQVSLRGLPMRYVRLRGHH